MKSSLNKRNNNEVQAARGRLRGALNDSIQNQEVDDISEDYDEEEDTQPMLTHRHRGRPKKVQPITVPVSPATSSSYLTPKRRKREHTEGSSGQKIQAESFVMKLFDRSLDLSKYSEHTSLYPICRAWIANQPRNPSIRSYRDARSPSPTERKENAPEVFLKLHRGDIRDLTCLPKPRKTDVPKIPPPTKEAKKYNKYEEIVSDDNIVFDKDELLSDNVAKWKQVKSNWQKHAKLYQQRYDVNFQIIDHLFKP